MTEGVPTEYVSSALARLADGDAFERFAQSFLSKVIGQSFQPVGGMHDRGVDGLEHTFSAIGRETTVYQASIDKDPRQKIRRTIKALQSNNIALDRLTYVTSQIISAPETLVEDLWEEFNLPVNLRDSRWFQSNVNLNQGTLAAYRSFIEDNFHEFDRPGKGVELANLSGDPRLYVFLRQVLDESRDIPLEVAVVDGLILFALEGTDPDLDRLMSREEIVEGIRGLVNFDVAAVERRIDERLSALSSGPEAGRLIRHHTADDRYVLAYETRLDIKQRDIRDAATMDEFQRTMTERLDRYGLGGISPDTAYSLVEKVIHDLFKQQGLEFANFVLYNDGDQVAEKLLPDLVSAAVADSSIPPPQRPAVLSAVLMGIREAVYNGTRAEADVLAFLARTYTMLFVISCDPNLYVYFSELSSKLVLYVDNSILIPAMSEHFLDGKNRRYANLLKRTSKTGARLYVNGRTMEELVSHFISLRNEYDRYFKGTEDVYDADEQIFYIEKMMLRAYFYARKRGNVTSFDEFLNAFVSPDLLRGRANDAELELRAFLKEEFGVEYQDSSALNLRLDPDERRGLATEIQRDREGAGAEARARGDADMILTILGLRRRAGEPKQGGTLGYSTWWLSMDTTSGRAAATILGDAYKNCYIRADFLNDFIALAPPKAAVDESFTQMFPSLTGVKMSYHVPFDVGYQTREFVRDYSRMNPGRVKGILQRFSNELMSHPRRSTDEFKSFLDQQREALEKSGPRRYG